MILKCKTDQKSREELWEIGLDSCEQIQIRGGDDGMKYVAMSMWALYKEKKGGSWRVFAWK